MKENKTKRVTFRVTEEEYRRLENRAKISERSISSYCRDSVFNKKITVINGIDEVISHLRRVGNNLNQLTWRANEGSIPVVHLGTTKYSLENIFKMLNEKLKGL